MGTVLFTLAVLWRYRENSPFHAQEKLSFIIHLDFLAAGSSQDRSCSFGCMRVIPIKRETTTAT